MNRQEFLSALNFNPETETNKIVSWLKETMAQKGFKRVVIGISGGIDSAVSAALAVRAVGSDNVIGISMPYAGLSSTSSILDARELTKKFGIKILQFPIGEIVDSYFLVYGRVRTNEGGDPMRKGNVCARTRMMILFDFSRVLGALVLGTENKSEKYLGYFTLHGDDASSLEPIQWYYKQEIFELAKYLGIPKSIIEKAPSAELTPLQTDEGELGFSYLDADKTIYFAEKYWFETRLMPEDYTLKSIADVHPDTLFDAVVNNIWTPEMKDYIAKSGGVDPLVVDKVCRTIGSVSFKHYLPTIFER